MALTSLEELSQPGHRIIAARDQDTWQEAMGSLPGLTETIGLAKVNSLADAVGPHEAVRRLTMLDLLTMMDLKIYDVDDTMLRRTREQTLAGSAMITLHASNSPAALAQATKGVEEALKINPNLKRPWLLGVTVLTSIPDGEHEVCTSIFGDIREVKVREFAYAAADAGFDGAVCSPQEAEMLKNDRHTEHLKLVVPAIRPSYAVAPDEQATAATPRVAMEAGADFLVVGRPLVKTAQYGITGGEAAQIIAEEIAEVL